MLPHQVMLSFASIRRSRERAQARRRRRLVDEVKAGLARLGDQRSMRCMTRSSPRPVVAADVVERDVAERALLPVAAVRQRELVPAAVRPEAVHRVEHLEQRHVAIERQAVVGRRARVALRNVVLRQVVLEHDAAPSRTYVRTSGCLAAPQPHQQIQQRPLAVVERDVVEVVEHARIAQLAQLGVDVAAAENQRRLGRRRADRARHAERAVDVAGKRHGHADDVRWLRDQLARELVERRVDQRRLARRAPRAADRRRRRSRPAARRSATARSAGRCRSARRRRGRRRRGWRGSAPAPSCPSVPNAASSCSSSAACSPVGGGLRCSKRGPSGRNARPTMRNARLGSRRCRNRTAGSTVST